MEGGDGVPGLLARTAAVPELWKTGSTKLKAMACCMIHLTETRSANLYAIDDLHLTRGRREVALCLAPKLSALWAARYAELPFLFRLL
jgi:hypothetical protein